MTTDKRLSDLLKALDLTPEQMQAKALASGQDRSDAEKQWAASTLASGAGFDSPDGAVFNKDWKPLDPSTYLDLMQRTYRNGLVELQTPELREWNALEAEPEKREKLALAARSFWDANVATPASELAGRVIAKPYLEEYELDDDTPDDVRQASQRIREESAYGTRYGQDESRTLVQQYRKEIQPKFRARRAVREYEAKLLAENAAYQFKLVQKELTPEAEEIVIDAFRHQTLRENQVEKFKTLEPDQQQLVAALVHASRPPTQRNLVVEAGRQFVKTLVDTPSKAVRHAVVDTFRQIVMDPAEYQRVAQTRAYLAEANAEKMKDYGYWGQSIIGVASTIPYMAYAGIPYAGIPMVAASAAADFEARVAAEGHDVSSPQFIAAKWATAVSYALVERLPSMRMKKDLTDLEMRGVFLNIFSKANALRAAGHLAGEARRETTEESIQKGLEDFLVAYATDKPAIREAVRGAVQEAYDTVGTMSLVSLAGGAFRTGMANTTRHFTLSEAVSGRMHAVRLIKAELEGDTPEIQRHRQALQPLAKLWTAAGTRARARREFERFYDPKTAEALEGIIAHEHRAVMSDPAITQEQRESFFGKGFNASEILSQLMPDATVAQNEDGSFTLSRTITRTVDGKPQNTVVLTRVDVSNALGFNPDDDAAAPSIVAAIKKADPDSKITEEDWLKMNGAERRVVAGQYGLYTAGEFRLDSDGTVVQEGHVEALAGTITLAESAVPSTAIHESLHAWVKYNLAIGSISEADIDALRAEYGDARPGVEELFNEEAAADAIQEYGSGKVRFVPGTVMDRLVESASAMLRNARRFRNAQRDQRTVTQSIFQQIRDGTWTGLTSATARPDPQGGTRKQAADEAARRKVEEQEAREREAALNAQRAQEAAEKKGKPTETGAPPTPGGMNLDSVKRKDEAAAERKRQGMTEDDATWHSETPTGNYTISGDIVFADFGDILISRDKGYPAAWQNRKESSVERQKKHDEIKKHPNYKHLGKSDWSNSGSPIIVDAASKGADSDPEVSFSQKPYIALTGNTRIWAIRDAYAEGKANDYAFWVKAQAARMGVVIPDGWTMPGLFRVVRDANGPLKTIAVNSNEDVVAELSPADRAVTDSRAILENDLVSKWAPANDGRIDTQSNFDFIVGFKQALNAGGITTALGYLTDEGASRIKRAMLALVFGHEPRGREITARLIEQAHDLGIKREADGITRASGALFYQAEVNPEYSLISELSDAVDDYVGFRTDGRNMTIDDWLNQGSLFGARTPETAALVRAFAQRRTAGGIGALLINYAERARRESPEPDMFGNQPRSKLDLINLAIESTKSEAEQAEIEEAKAEDGSPHVSIPTPAAAPVAAKEAKLVSDLAIPRGRWRAVTPQGNVTVEGSIQQFDIDDLVTSDSPWYPKPLQPRTRDTAASFSQIDSIRKRPDPLQLFDSPTTDAGSPLVVRMRVTMTDQNEQLLERIAPVVLSGNDLVIGLRLALRDGNFEAYARYSRVYAAKHGIVTPDAIKTPLTVRVLEGDYSDKDLERIAELSNREITLQRTQTELAERAALEEKPDEEPAPVPVQPAQPAAGQDPVTTPQPNLAPPAQPSAEPTAPAAPIFTPPPKPKTAEQIDQAVVDAFSKSIESATDPAPIPDDQTANSYDADRFFRDTPELPYAESANPQWRTQAGNTDSNKLKQIMPYPFAGNKGDIIARHMLLLKALLDASPAGMCDCFGGAATYTLIMSAVNGGKLPAGSRLNEFDLARFITLHQIQQDPDAIESALRELYTRLLARFEGVVPANNEELGQARNALVQWMDDELHARNQGAPQYIADQQDDVHKRVRLVNSPQTAALYLLAQNMMSQSRPVSPQAVEAHGIVWHSGDNPSVAEFAGPTFFEPGPMTPPSMDSIAKRIRRSSELLQGVEISEGDGWKLASSAEQGALVTLDSSYFEPLFTRGTKKDARKKAKTISYSAANNDDTNPAVWTRKLRAVVAAIREKGRSIDDYNFFITNNWNDQVVEAVEELGFRVARTYRERPDGKNKGKAIRVPEMVALSGAAKAIVPQVGTFGRPEGDGRRRTYYPSSTYGLFDARYSIAADLSAHGWTPESAQRTQIATTVATYKKMKPMVAGRVLDYGAGKGLGAKEIGADTLEPFPSGWTPDYTDATKIADSTYDTVVNSYVLNVVPDDVRDNIVKDIWRVLRPNGKAIILARGADVNNAKSKARLGDAELITSAGTYQKGFTQAELEAYVRRMLPDATVAKAGIGTTGVVVSKPATRYSIAARVTPEQDAAYLAAVERGDMDTAQRMVNWAARMAGYILHAYHGSPQRPFWIFDPLRRGERTGSNSALLGFFASTYRAVASEYKLTANERYGAMKQGPLGYGLEDAERNVAIAEDIGTDAVYDDEEKGWLAQITDHNQFGDTITYNDGMVYDTKAEALDAADVERDKEIAKAQKRLEEAVEKNRVAAEAMDADRTLHNLYVRLSNPLIYDYDGGTFKDKSYSDLVQEAIDKGHDGVIMKNTRDAVDSDTPSNVIVFFESSQAKLADAVTRDDAGRVIPLSERFNEETPDIRYSIAAETDPLGLYSQLRAVLDQKMPARQSVRDLRNLTDPQKGTGIKADELQWSGFAAWLDSLPEDAVVTKEQALDAARDFVLEETVLTGADPSNPSDDAATRFGNYTLPGNDYGTYNERLLTIPVAPPSVEDSGFEIVADPNRPGRFAIRNPKGNKIEWNLTESEARRRIRAYVAVMPDNASFQSSHWRGHKNVLLHIRHADRTTADGKAILVEEIQSDWHQQGRDRGYKLAPDEWVDGVVHRLRLQAQATDIVDEINALSDKGRAAIIESGSLPEGWEIRESVPTAKRLGLIWSVFDETGSPVSQARTKEAALEYSRAALRGRAVILPADRERYDALQTEYERISDELAADGEESRNKSRPPRAPFADTSKGWARLALKRVFRLAAERGITRVLWTTGRTQIERYENSMRQAVDEMEWQKEGYAQQNVLVVRKGGRDVMKAQYNANGIVESGSHDEAVGKHLSDLIGKDAARKVMAEPSGTLKGDDLHIGGEGMVEFYDRILVRIANDLGKKYGAKAERTPASDPHATVASKAIQKTASELASRMDEHGIVEGLPDDVDQESASRVFGAMEEGETFAVAIAAERKHGDRDSADALARHVEALATAVPVWSIDIPEAMRADILKGQARFSIESSSLADIGQSEQEQDATPQARNAFEATGRKTSGASSAVAVLSVMRLEGSEPTPEDASRYIRIFGAQGVTPDGLIAESKTYAESAVGEAARRAMVAQDPAGAASIIARQAEFDAIGTAREGAKIGARMGRLAQKAEDEAQKSLIRDAIGTDMTELVIDTGIDPVETLLAVLPETFDPGAKKPADPDTAAEDAESTDNGPHATPEQLANRDARCQNLVEIAKAWFAAYDARRKQRAEARAQREAERQDEEAIDDESRDAEPDPDADEEGIGAIPVELLKGARVDLTNALEFARFLRLWVQDWIVTHSDGRLTAASVWTEPESVAKYRRTMQATLRQMARGLLAPTDGTARLTEQMIGDMADLDRQDDVERRTVAALRVIQRNAIRQTRKQLIRALRKDIKVMAEQKKRFDPMQEDLRRKVTAPTEDIARYIRDVIAWTPARVEKERQKLQEIVSDRAALYDSEHNEAARDIETDNAYRKALLRLGALNRWGALRELLPAEIQAAGEEITQWLSGEQDRLQERWFAIAEENATYATALVEGIQGEDPDRPMLQESGFERLTDSLIATVDQRLRDSIKLARGTTREAALKAVEQINYLLAKGAERYNVLMQQYRQDWQDSIEGVVGRHGITEYMQHLHDKIPEDVSRVLSKGRYAGTMTYGQAIQLYVSIQQEFYSSNVVRHGRQDHARIIEGILTTDDMRIIGRLRDIYEARREELSASVQAVTGLPVWRPDVLYMPVQMDIGAREGLRSHGAMAWTALSATLTPRQKNGRDFDEAATIQGIYHERAKDAAAAIAYGEVGIRLRGILGAKSVREALQRYWGKARTAALYRQVEEALIGERVPSEGPLEKGMETLLRLNTYAALSFNPSSTLKQAFSMPVWGMVLDGGSRDVIGALRAVIHEPETVRAFMDSDGFRARYRGGIMREFQEVFMRPGRNWLERFYQAGMQGIQFGDMLPSVFVGAGLYRMKRDALTDGGMDPQEADARAKTLAWDMVEKAMQSGRTENLPAIYRSGSVWARSVLQFGSAQLLQLSHEIQAIREARAGVPGAKGRATRAVVINHVVMPFLMSLATGIISALIGEDDDDEDIPDAVLAFLWEMTLGPFSRVVVLGAWAQAAYDALVRRKRTPFTRLVPAENVFRATESLGITIHDIATQDADRLRDDILRLARDTSAPGRITYRWIRAREEDAQASRRESR